MNPSQQCKQAGLESLSQLVQLSGISKSTLLDWHKGNQVKFRVAIDAALHRQGHKIFGTVKGNELNFEPLTFEHIGEAPDADEKLANPKPITVTHVPIKKSKGVVTIDVRGTWADKELMNGATYCVSNTNLDTGDTTYAYYELNDGILTKVEK